jgi:hypothetical protein
MKYDTFANKGEQAVECFRKGFKALLLQATSVRENVLRWKSTCR